MKNKKIAVVGVSSNPNKYGYKIFKDLIENEYEVYGINPKLKELFNQTIYPSLKDIPQKIDTLIMVVPPQITEKIVDECIELGIKEIWFQPGSESEKAIEKAKKNGIKTITACFMVSNKIW